MEVSVIHPVPALQVLACGSTAGIRWPAGPFVAARPFWRAYWAATPCARLRYRSRDLIMGPEQLIAIAPETDYQRVSLAAMDQVYVHFALSVEAEVAPGLYPLAVDAVQQAAIAGFGAALAVDAQAPRTAVLAVRHCAQALLAVPEAAWRRRMLDPRMAMATAALATRLRDPPSNSELAAMVGMHVNAFTRLFRQAVGTTPQRYLTQRRVAEACHLLEHSQSPIGAIASVVGCCDRYHLSRIFTRLRGLPPATWRRAARAGRDGGRSAP